MASSTCRRLTLTVSTTLQNLKPFSHTLLLHRIFPLSATFTFPSDPLTTSISSPQNPQSSSVSAPSTKVSHLSYQRSNFSTHTTRITHLLSQRSYVSAQRSNFSLPTTQRSDLFPPNPISILPANTIGHPIYQASKTHLCNPQRRCLSASPDPTDPSGAQQQVPGFHHQEITGPTVEHDGSALANETRRVLESLRKAIYDLSLSLALLGAAHLGLGAWIAHVAEPPCEVMVQGITAFAFPFTLAFLMRRTLKPLSFFSKMEEQGRLQVLTLALQSSKSLRTTLLRVRVVAMFCVLGVSVGSISVIWMR